MGVWATIRLDPPESGRKNRWFLKARLAIRRRPDFSGQTAPRLPSRQTNRRKAVKTEVSNNEGTDTSGGCPVRATPKLSGRKLGIPIAYWATAMRRAARLRRRRA